MKSILITGATGNVGSVIIKYLRVAKGSFKILAGVRNVEENMFTQQSDVEAIYFDFKDKESVKRALSKSDIVFLLRPPQLANVNLYFKPVITIAKEENIRHIVFLSVQGADKNIFIPHNKIENLIKASSLPYTFLRPAYFMQNFTTTLKEGIVKNKEIFLPAGDAKFTLIDTEDVGRTAAKILTDLNKHVNATYELTNQEQLTFHQMATILSEELGEKISFTDPNIFYFLWRKKKEGTSIIFILVLIMLHYLPRFNSTPSITHSIEKITGEKPITFRNFIGKNITSFAQFR